MGGTSNSTGYRSFVAANAIAEGQRIKTVAGQADVAAAADAAIGVAVEAVAAGGIVNVKLFSAPGTFIFKASGAIAVDARLYPTAAGCVDDAGTTPINFGAVEAATAAGDLIECARIEIGS